MKESDILFIDNHLLVVCKPAGLLVQGDSTGDETLLEQAKAYLKERFGKPGNVFLGLVHRLDRPVSGVLLLARTSKAAARISEQFRTGNAGKVYLAIVEGEVPLEGEWVDRIVRAGPTSRIAKEREGQEARLSFRRLQYKNGFSQVEVALHTGRHHQIRLQFASRGYPLLGDFRYGSKIKFGERAVALHARSLTVIHPTLKKEMTFIAEAEGFWTDFVSST